MNDPDTDYDGRSDGEEWAEGTDPLVATNALATRLNWFKFNDTNYYGILTNAPVIISNVVNSSAWISRGLLVDNISTNVELRYRDVETNLYRAPANINCRNGSVRFWFRPDWSSSSNQLTDRATLIEVGTNAVNATNLFLVQLETNGTSLLFRTASNSFPSTNLLATNLYFHSNLWYQLVLNYTPSNCALYTNGVLAESNNIGVSLYPERGYRLTNGFNIGSSKDGSRQAQGTFEDLETFNYPLSEAQILTNYVQTRPVDHVPDLRYWFVADEGYGLVWTNRLGPTIFNPSAPAIRTNLQANFSSASPLQIPNAITNADGVTHNVIRFDGTNHFMQFINSFTNLNHTEAEAFIVLRSMRAAGQLNGLWYMGDSRTDGKDARHPSEIGELWDGFGSRMAHQMGVPLHAVTNYHLYNPLSKTDRWEARLNGLLLYAASTNEMRFGVSPVILGGNETGALPRFEGEIAEILFFTRVLTDVERQNVGVFLSSRYALVTNAPATVSNFVAIAVSSNQVHLAWDYPLTNNYGTLFVLERKQGTGAYQQVGAANDALSYFDADTNLLPSTTYFYRLTATNFFSAGTSLETSVTTPSATVTMPLTNLFLWLKGDAGILLKTNSTVSEWLDQSGNTNHVWSQWNVSGGIWTVGTNQPQYTARETNTRPVLNFNLVNDWNGTNDYFMPLTGTMTNLTESEVYIVLKANPNKTNSSTQGFWNMGTNTNWKTRYADQLNRIVDNFASTNIFALNLTNSTVNIGEYHLYRVVSKTNDWKSWLNDAAFFTNSVANKPGFPNAPTIGKSAADVSGSVYFSGNLAELLIFSPPISNSATNTVRDYLRTKYNLW